MKRRRNRSWAALRALSIDTVLGALKVERRGDCLLCPRCKCLFEAFDDPSYGVSVRCTDKSCQLNDWAWPEQLLADLVHCDLDDALKRLVEEETDPSRVGDAVEEARQTVAAFLS